jgi:uncharacterized protein
MGINRTFKAAVAALMLAVGFAGSVAAGPLEEGVAAYDRGDYASAMRLLRPLADQGNANAQYYLGILYYFVMGPKDDAAWAVAESWFRKAADQGNGPSVGQPEQRHPHHLKATDA